MLSAKMLTCLAKVLICSTKMVTVKLKTRVLTEDMSTPL